jgi:hypothetical protein
MIIQDSHSPGLGAIEVRALPLPDSITLRSATYTFSGTVLVSYSTDAGPKTADYENLALVNDNGTGFRNIFSGVIAKKKTANGIRHMVFRDNKRILLGDYALECFPDIDACEKAALIPVEYPWNLHKDPRTMCHWSEIIIALDNEHIVWTILHADFSAAAIGTLKRQEDRYVITGPQFISSRESMKQDPAIFGFMPRPHSYVVQGMMMSLYMYAVAGVRAFRPGNIEGKIAGGHSGYIEYTRRGGVGVSGAGGSTESVYVIFAWKSRDVSIAAVNVVAGFLTIFCTDTLGMPAALAGTLFLISKVFDGVTDLFAAYIIENTNTRLGKARPYEFSIIGAWLCTFLLFCASPEWSMIAKSIWVCAMYTFVFSIFNTLLLAGQTPYALRAFPRRQVVTKVFSYGGIVTMLGSMIVAVSFPMVMAKLATNPAGWRQMIAMYAVPLLLIGLLRLIFVKEVVKTDADAAERVPVKKILTMLKSNKYVWLLGGMNGFFNVVVGLNVTAYFFRYVIGNLALMGPMQMISMVMLLAMFVMPQLTKRFSTPVIIAGSAVISLTGLCYPFPCRYEYCTADNRRRFSGDYYHAHVLPAHTDHHGCGGLQRMERACADGRLNQRRR